MRELENAGGAPQQLASLPKNMIATLWTKRGQELVLVGATRQGQVISWRPVGGALKELGSFSEQLTGALLSNVQFSSQGDWLIGLTDQGFGVLYHISRAQTQVITIPQGKLKVAQFLAPDEATLAQPPALVLGSSSGRLWLWREGRLMPLGDHQGPIIKLKVSPTDGSLISASETLALRWQGPFLLDDLKEKLSKRPRICLSPAERNLLLAEPLTEAKNQHQRCVENR